MVESGFYCAVVGQPCRRSICGDGVINGGELCDDKNIVDGDGCSSICLIESRTTCLGVPSRCFGVETANLTLISVHANSNNVYIRVKTPWKVIFNNEVLAQTFIKVKLLSSPLSATPYCQQDVNLDEFVCLLIYPNGTPMSR